MYVLYHCSVNCQTVETENRKLDVNYNMIGEQVTVEQLRLYKYERSRKCNKVADNSKKSIKNTNHGNVY